MFKIDESKLPLWRGNFSIPLNAIWKTLDCEVLSICLSTKTDFVFHCDLLISKEEFCYKSFIGNTWIKLTYFLFEAVKIIQFMKCISQTLPGLSGSDNCNYLNIDKSNLMQCWQFYQVSQISHKNYSKKML